MTSEIMVISPANTQDWQNTAYFFLILLAIILGFELLHKKFRLPHKYSRKAIHILVGLSLIISSNFIHSVQPILLLTFMFAIINLFAIRKIIFASMHDSSQSLGTFFYPISLFITAMLFRESNILIFNTGVAILSLGDASAALIGSKFGRNHFKVMKDPKSVTGSAALFTITFFIVLSVAIYYHRYGIIDSIMFSSAVAIAVTAAELPSARGSDNLTVTLFAAIMLAAFFHPQFKAIRYQVLTGEVLAGFIAYASFRLKFVTADGAVATFLLGTIIFGFGGGAGAAPILAFFILSSLLSHVGKAKKLKIKLEYEKSSVRDAIQVLANGGAGGLFIILWKFTNDPMYFWMYATGISVATADTWSTEIGIFSKTDPRNIINFQKVAKGTSGGLTILGTFAGILGSAVIAFITLIFAAETIGDYSSITVLSIFILTGQLGNLLDSTLGAIFQGHYRCLKCGIPTEKKKHCETETEMVSGIRAVNNDTVNFLAIVTTSILAAFLY